jgi:hypothetical protein
MDAVTRFTSIFCALGDIHQALRPARSLSLSSEIQAFPRNFSPQVDLAAGLRPAEWKFQTLKLKDLQVPNAVATWQRCRNRLTMDCKISDFPMVVLERHVRSIQSILYHSIEIENHTYEHHTEPPVIPVPFRSVFRCRFLSSYRHVPRCSKRDGSSWRKVFR